MLRGTRKILLGCGVIAVAVTLILVFGGDNVFSHSGRTDSSGGHRNRKTGGYHYHGGGPCETYCAVQIVCDSEKGDVQR